MINDTGNNPTHGSYLDVTSSTTIYQSTIGNLTMRNIPYPYKEFYNPTDKCVYIVNDMTTGNTGVASRVRVPGGEKEVSQIEWEGSYAHSICPGNRGRSANMILTFGRIHSICTLMLTRQNNPNTE